MLLPTQYGNSENDRPIMQVAENCLKRDETRKYRLPEKLSEVKTIRHKLPAKQVGRLSGQMSLSMNTIIPVLKLL